MQKLLLNLTSEIANHKKNASGESYGLNKTVDRRKAGGCD